MNPVPNPVVPVANRFTRRHALRLGGLGVVGAIVAACGSTSSNTTDGTGASTASDVGSAAEATTEATVDAAAATAAELASLSARDFASLGACQLAPEKTAGPYPLDEQFNRRDVTEGMPGHPTRLGFRVLDDNCAPVSSATVEIWHVDATGDYSAFVDNGGGKDSGPGTTFLRGTQPTNADGIVEFHTVYPGWYRGRAVHIHLRVHMNDQIVLTSQVFFDADYTASVYQSAPYSDNGLPDTPNESDNIAGDVKAEGTLMATIAGPTLRGTGTVALINLGINPTTLFG